MLRPGQRTVVCVDEGLQFLHQHAAIGIRMPAAETLVFDRRVLVHPLHPRVVNAHDDKRLDRPSLYQSIRSFAHVPVVSLDK